MPPTSRHALILYALLALASLAAACSGTHATSASNGYQVETLVAGGPLHGAKGITFGPDGYLYVCSVYAQKIYRVDVSTGDVSVAVGAPHGESDDVAFGPDGLMVWSALPSAELRARYNDGEPFVMAAKLPLINPVGFTDDGRLFVAQIGIDRFLEVDVSGEQPPRLVAKGIGHLNSFDITADDQLYGPLAGIGTLTRIDLATGELTAVATGQDTLSAVELDADGQIYAVGWNTGELLRFDADTGAATLITTLEPPLDNLAINADGIYISQPAAGRIVLVNPDTGAQNIVVPGNLGIPGGLALTTVDGHETLLVADDFAFRWVDTDTGRVWATADLADFMDPSSASDVAINDAVIVLSDVSKSRVYMLDRATGEKIQQWRGLDTPYGLVLRANGDPLVAEFGSGQLVQLKQDDRKARDIVASGLDGPVDIVWADDASVYVTEATAGTVARIDITSGAKTIIAAGLNQPEGLTLIAGGQLVVVEAGAQQLTQIDPATGATTVLADKLPINAVVPAAPGPVYVPTGVVADSNGTLYISSDREHSVLRLVPGQ